MSATTTEGWVGRRVKRVEDPRILRGIGRYVDDVTPPGCLHAAFVRSPVAHARIDAIDIDAARAAPGVHGVFRAEDFNAICGSWCGLLDWPGLVSGEQRPLATGKVRYVGEPVVLVVAAGRPQAEDAAELVVLRLTELDPVVDAVAAVDGECAVIHDEIGHNLAYEADFGSGDVTDVFTAVQAAGGAVVELAMSTARHTAVSLEGRGVVAEYDPAARALTARISTQAPHLLQTTFAELLGLRESDVRILTDEVGGAFGMKAHVYPDEIATCCASMLLRRPVKWIQDRVESLQSDTQARDERVRAALAVDADGTIAALRSEIVSDGGAYSVYPRSMVTEGIQVAAIMPGPYRIPAYDGHLRVAITNKAPLAVYRGVGHPVAILVMEALIDEAARALELDPLELRRRNTIGPDELPFTSITGHVYDSGSHAEALERLARRRAELDLDARRDQAAGRGRVLGAGIAAFVEVTAPGVGFYGARGAPITAHDQVELRMEPDGSVTAVLGTPGQGQGLHTTAAQVIADHLGIAIDQISVISGDTATTPHGTGVWASRSAVVSAGAAATAAGSLRTKICAIAAHLLEASAEDIEIRDGQVAVVGAPGSGMPIAEIAAIAHFRTHRLPAGTDVGLAVVGEYVGPNVTFNNGAHLALVELDPETGTVELVGYTCIEDCGVLINPDIVDGQVRGGVTQGVGGALLERLHYDEDGQLQTSTLLDYLMPAAGSICDIEIFHLESPSPLTLLGTKGAGEAGAAGAPGAVHNAVNDALARHTPGARVSHQPLTPERVLHALATARGRSWDPAPPHPRVPAWRPRRSEGADDVGK